MKITCVESNKNRISYFDGLKAVCIFLVVYDHTAFVSNESVIGNFLTTLTWAAVPIFMMITGALSHRSNDFDLKKYIKRLIKTYLILCLWKTIYLFFGIIFNDVHYGVAQCVQYIFFFLDLSGINYAHTWFMVAYIIALLMYPITNYMFNEKGGHAGRKILMCLGVLCLFSGIIIHDLDWWFGEFLNLLSISKLPIVGIETILPFINYPNMIFYYILGAFMFEYKVEISKKIHKHRSLLFVALLFSIFMLMLIKYIETGSFAWNSVYVTIGYNRISTVIMAISLYLIFYEYKENLSWFNNVIGKYIGRNTLGIFYLHVIAIALIKTYFGTFIDNNLSIIFSIVSAIVITTICDVITLIIKKIPYIKNIVS